jgi:hypothetical protein
LYQGKVIDSEKERTKERLRAHYANDIWEHREKPPLDWNKELPDDILEAYEGSYLQAKSEELRTGKVIVQEEAPYVFTGLSCSIV